MVTAPAFGGRAPHRRAASPHLHAPRLPVPTEGPEDELSSRRVHNDLVAIAGCTMLVHELHIAAMVGRRGVQAPRHPPSPRRAMCPRRPRDPAARSSSVSRVTRRRSVGGSTPGFAGLAWGSAWSCVRRPKGVARMQVIGVSTMILPKVRDPRFVTIHRRGTLTDSDHQLLALWAASCAEHVLDLFESAQPEDPRPRQAIEDARAWVRGEVKMTQARTGGWPCNGCGQRPAWGSAACRVRCWPGQGRLARHCARTRCRCQGGRVSEPAGPEGPFAGLPA
jgi:hypothetical protein